ncbi:MAG TPA: carboxypeptidase regulatory-like domain-containing protein [Candidatus Acidoferrum sp.]
MALGLAIASQVGAQIISGDLVGTVLDKTGGVVPGATVEAVNVATGVKYTTKSNDAGEYRINNLPVGTYNISGSATDFATTTFNGFAVELNKTSTLQITLEVKGTAATIEVSGFTPAVDTSSAQVTNTFETKEIADLPSATSGSGVLNLSLLGSGVATSGGVGVGTGPSVGGQRPRNNNFTIEGVDNNSKGVTGPLASVPNDAVAEFSLLQNQFSSEFGHSSGGQFNTVVKSGTNSYHGLAYIYNQNRHYDALDTQQAIQGLGSGPLCGSATGTPADCSSPGPRFDFNRFGGQVGGPVFKNKLFFFADYEYQPLGQAGGAGAVCAPTAAGFTMINNTPGLSATNVAQFEKYVPAGTLPGVGCGPIPWVNGSSVPTAGLAVVSPSFSNTKILVTSMDYNISSKDQLRGRYIYNNFAGIDTAATLPVFFTSTPAVNHLVAINEYHTFSPTLTNEFRLGFNRFASITPSGNFSFPGLDSFPNLQFQAADLQGLQIGPDPNAPQSSVQNTYSAAEAITWTKKAHTLKFGVEGRKLIAPQTFTQRSRGDYEYATTLKYFEDAPPDFLAERSNGDPVFYGDQAAIYWFANDNWRIRQNLTLDLGVRYEYTTTPFTTRSQALNSAASVPGLITFGAPQPAPNNWAPRIGLAYSPGKDGRTSIRAGFGEAYDVLFDNLGLLSLPPQLSSTIDCAPLGSFNCPTPFLGSGGILPGPGGIRTFPSVAAQRAATSAFLPDQLKDPKSIDYTLGVQHTFAKDYTLEVRYVGTRGIHLPAQIQINKQPVVTSSFNLPTFTTAPSQATLDALTTTLGAIQTAASPAVHGEIVPAYLAAGLTSTITSYQPAASSTYNGLAVQLNKRISNGLQFVGAYTYSHLIDDATAEVFSTVLAPRRAQNGLDLSNDFANSILDHRHRFTLSLIYDEPFFKNRNAFLKNAIGNWEFAPIYTYQSGQWVTAQSGVDSNVNGDSAGDRAIFNSKGVPGTGTGVTPLCNSGLPTGTACSASPANIVAYAAINPNAQYIQAAVGAVADVGRNTLQLAPINDIDMTAVKRFTITERFRVEFQAQFFNLLNHPQFVGGFLNDIAPVGFTGSQVNVLRPQSSDFNTPSTQFASNARSMQLALKFFF